MKIKRYIDKDMRQVLRRVREDQGPDAVILSTRRVEDGIEVIAAIDYDEALIRQAVGPVPAAAAAADGDGDRNVSAPRAASPKFAARAEADSATLREEPCVTPPAPEAVAPAAVRRPAAVRALPAAGDPAPTDGADLAAMRAELTSLRGLLETQLSGLLWKRTARRSPLRAQILRNLALLGIAPDVARTIADALEPVENVRQLWRDPLAKLAQAVPVLTDDLLTDGGTAALVGPTGVGKTTTVAKLAAAWAMRHGVDDMALVCADAFRIGAREHLEAFAKVIGVEVHAAADAVELAGVLQRVRSKKLVLIDTEGLGQRGVALAGSLVARLPDAGVHLYLTLSAASQEACLDETVRQFGCLPLAGAVVTKIDEAAQLGCVIGTLIRHGLPASWLSDGQRIPDDLYRADRKKLWLVDRAVECVESSGARVDERMMAENYGQAAVVNA